MDSVDKLNYLRRDLSGIRHDWAKVCGNDAIVCAIDEVMKKMDEVIETHEYAAWLSREMRKRQEDNPNGYV